MRRFHVLPDPVLRPFIDRLWGWESGQGEEIALPTLLPGTGAELYFHYRQPFRHLTPQGQPVACPPAHLLCLRSRPLALCPSGDLGFIAVRFRAGMLHRFTPVPAGELLDRILPADELWGRSGLAVMHGVAASATAPTRLRLIQDFLLDCLRAKAADDLAEHAVAALYRESAGISIAQLATRLRLGRRQLERRVRALSGQTPAELRRLGRLQKSVRALLLAPGTALLDVALANGYYDQSHFNRDCRQLAQASPGRLLQMARAKTHFYNTPHNASGMMTTSVSSY